jgi:transposase
MKGCGSAGGSTSPGTGASGIPTRQAVSDEPPRNTDAGCFAVQPRRWVVERLFACLNRNRRLAKDVSVAGTPTRSGYLKTSRRSLHRHGPALRRLRHASLAQAGTLRVRLETGSLALHRRRRFYFIYFSKKARTFSGYLPK